MNQTQQAMYTAQTERLEKALALRDQLLQQALDERDRARTTAVELEQQLDAVRAGLAVAAGEVRGFSERHTDEYVRGQYETLIRDLAVVLETTGEHYDGLDPESAAHELARALDQGDIEHAGQKLPQPLDLDDEAREEARLDELSSIAGWSA